MAKNKIKKGITKVKKTLNKVNKIANALGHVDLTGTAGAKVGGAIGKKLGNRQIGQNIGRFIGSAIGKGDYVVSANALGRSSANLGAQVPAFGRNNESTIIEHREYIGDLISSPVSGTFNISKYVFNPNNSTLFPWLSIIAGNYEQYEPLGAIVAFKSMSSDFNASGQTLGKVCIAADYDVRDATYNTMVEMENSTFAVACKPSESMLHPIECDPKLRPTRLLYTGAADSASDSRFHDLCNVQVASSGVTGTSVNLGELWITYRIRFHKPQVTSSLLNNLFITYSSCNPNSSTAFWGGTTTLNSNFSNNINGDILFGIQTIGMPYIRFESDRTHYRLYQVTFSVTVDTVHAGILNTINFSAGDAQISIVNQQNTVKDTLGNITVTDIYTATAIVYIKRNPIAATSPELRFILGQTGSDWAGAVRVSIFELPLQILTYNP